MNDSILRSIEKGTFMIKETKKRSEEIYVRIRLESKQIVKVNKVKEGSKRSMKEDEVVIVDIAHIIDVRNSDDDSIFHKTINPLKSGININAKINLGFRFTIHHGLQFNLKTVSFRAPDTAQYFDWITGLKYLVDKYSEMPYETLVECWLWKHYYEIAENVTDSKIKGPVEIDDEFIIPAAFNKVISSSLGSLRDAPDTPKLDHRDDASSNQEKRSKSKFKFSKTDAIFTNMKRIKKQSANNNFRHFRRYSWCTNNSSTVDLSANLRFASLDPADTNKSIKSFNVKISPKQLNVWIAQQNGTKMAMDSIKEYNCNYPPKPNFIDFIGFVKIYREFFFQPEIFIKIIENRLKKVSRKSNSSSIKFKMKTNNSKLNPVDLEWLETINNHYINYDFQNLDLDSLFSQSNSIWDPRRAQEVYQDMDQQLSAYYISTSHNSYLTGDQITSKSSCEAYTRCLQMGCRSVELDCWNGDKEPIIYHGNTLTSKIKLADVLQTIRKCAWQKSVYPIILSLEDHCSIPQQIIIAQMMQEIFQEDLLNGPVKTEKSFSNALPSPNQLKNKIILKHKKLPIDSLVKSESQNGLNDSTDDNQDNALSNYLFSGRMYMKDLFLDTWTPYYFLLTQARTLVYTEDTSVSDNDHGVNEIMPFHKPILQTDHSICDLRNFDNSATFITIDQGETLSINCNGCIPSELTNKTKLPNWFYGSLSRMETNNWLLRYWFLGDGTFLIRTSESFPGNYSLSFYRKDKVHHVRICRFVDRFSHKISLGFEYCDIQFATMEDLITHYQENDMVALDFTIRLKSPPPERFQDSSWFYENPPVDLIAAEKILNKIPLIGSFLVTREKKQLLIDDSIHSINFEQGRNFTEDHFILSYKGRGNTVVHNTIGYDGFQFTLFNQATNSLVELVCYFFKNRLSDGVKLKYPADSNLIKKCKMLLKKSPSYPFSKEMEGIMNQENQELLVHENDISICPSATANDLLSLHQDLDPESSSINDHIITRENQTNRVAEPVTFKIHENENGDVSNLGPLGNLEMGNFQLDSDCYVKVVNSDLNDFNSMMFAFDLYIVDFKIQLACETEQQRLDWINAINNCLDVNTENEMYLIHRKKEIQHKIAKPLSDLIIYCSSVPFSWPDNPDDFIKLLNSPCRDMSSISENRFIKLLSSKSNNDTIITHGIHNNNNNNNNSNSNNHNGCSEISMSNLHDFIEYHKMHLTRVYPKATRLDSSNLSPILPWLAGVQMAAINFQTPDRPSQLNQALFRDNGGCGFVLKDSNVFSPTQHLKISLIFLGARHLPKITKGLLEIEVISLFDEICERKTFPLKSEFRVTDIDIPDIVFFVKNPNFAFIRFAFGSDEKLGQKKRLNSCQATFLVRGIRPGIRSVNLRNGFDYLHDLATLLFYVELVITEPDQI